MATKLSKAQEKQLRILADAKEFFHSPNPPEWEEWQINMKLTDGEGCNMDQRVAPGLRKLGFVEDFKTEHMVIEKQRITFAGAEAIGCEDLFPAHDLYKQYRQGCASGGFTAMSYELWYQERQQSLEAEPSPVVQEAVEVIEPGDMVRIRSHVQPFPEPYAEDFIECRDTEAVGKVLLVETRSDIERPIICDFPIHQEWHFNADELEIVDVDDLHREMAEALTLRHTDGWAAEVRGARVQPGYPFFDQSYGTQFKPVAVLEAEDPERPLNADEAVAYGDLSRQMMERAYNEDAIPVEDDMSFDAPAPGQVDAWLNGETRIETLPEYDRELLLEFDWLAEQSRVIYHDNAKSKAAVERLVRAGYLELSYGRPDGDVYRLTFKGFSWLKAREAADRPKPVVIGEIPPDVLERLRSEFVTGFDGSRIERVSSKTEVLRQQVADLQARIRELENAREADRNLLLLELKAEHGTKIDAAQDAFEKAWLEFETNPTAENAALAAVANLRDVVHQVEDERDTANETLKTMRGMLMDALIEGLEPGEEVRALQQLIERERKADGAKMRALAAKNQYVDLLKDQLTIFAHAEAFGFIIKLDDAVRHVNNAKILLNGGNL